MTKDELVEKIKKILALAESSNPNEAAVALQRAQKLMEKYKIEASDLDNDCSISEIKVEPVTGLKSRDCTSLLLGIICKNFGVEAFSFFNKSSLSYVIFVGPKEILASCEYVYVLLARYTLAAQKNYNTTVWGETLLEVAHQDFYTEQIKRINPKFYKDFLGEIIETVSKAKDLDLPSFHLEYLGKQFQAYLDVYKDYDYESTKKFFQKMVSDKRKAFLNGFLLEVAKKVQELALTDEVEPFARVTAHSASSVDITARVWTLAGDYWTVYFDVLEEVREEFNKNGITIPFNQLDVHVDTVTK